MVGVVIFLWNLLSSTLCRRKYFRTNVGKEKIKKQLKRRNRIIYKKVCINCFFNIVGSGTLKSKCILYFQQINQKFTSKVVSHAVEIIFPVKSKQLIIFSKLGKNKYIGTVSLFFHYFYTLTGLQSSQNQVFICSSNRTKKNCFSNWWIKF